MKYGSGKVSHDHIDWRGEHLIRARGPKPLPQVHAAVEEVDVSVLRSLSHLTMMQAAAATGLEYRRVAYLRKVHNLSFVPGYYHKITEQQLRDHSHLTCSEAARLLKVRYGTAWALSKKYNITWGKK